MEPPSTDSTNEDIDRDSGKWDTTHRRDFLLASGAGITTSLAGCIGVGGSQDTQQETTEPTEAATFRLHWYLASNLYANITAAEEWTWPKHGVEVDVKTANGAQAAAKSVSSGKEMFGSGGYGAVLQLISSGAPLTVVANFTGPWGGVISLEDANITDWKDLEGKTVGQFPFGSTPIVAKTAMKQKGVDLSSVQFQNVQPGSAISLLMEGKLDAIIRYIPQTRARLELQGYSPNALKSVDVLDHLGLAFYAHNNVVENDPELVDKMVAGFLDGMKYWANNHDSVMAAQKERVEGSKWRPEFNERLLGPVYAAQAPPREIGLEHGKGWISEDRVQKTIDIFQEAGALESTIEPSDVYTNQFIEQHNTLAVDTAKALYTQLEDFEEGPDYI